MDFYLRKVRVYLRKNGRVVHTINPGDATDDQIQVEFQVSKSLSSSANSAVIDIWNLAPGTRNAMGKEFDGIVVEAGYIPHSGETNMGVIFAGSLRDTEHKRDGTEIRTTVQCGDGDAALRRAVTNKTFPKGTEVGDIVDELAKQFEKEGISRGEIKGLDDLPKTKRPYSMCGSCSREMDRLGRTHGFYWSMQNETLEAVPNDGYVGGIVMLAPDTGMIGVPTITDNGIKVEAFLNPQIRPGRRVSISSETLEMNSEGGVYRVGSCDFQGNNRSGDFKVAIHAESLASGKVDEGSARVPIPTPRPGVASSIPIPTARPSN